MGVDYSCITKTNDTKIHEYLAAQSDQVFTLSDEKRQETNGKPVENCLFEDISVNIKKKPIPVNIKKNKPETTIQQKTWNKIKSVLKRYKIHPS